MIPKVCRKIYTLLPFEIYFLCESGFSAVGVIKFKYCAKINDLKKFVIETVEFVQSYCFLI